MLKIVIAKYYKLITITLVCLLVLDILKNSYGLIWYLKINGFAPLYYEWAQYTSIDLLNILLLYFKRFRIIGLLLLAGNMISAIAFLFEIHSDNLNSWIQTGNFAGAVTIIMWWIALLISLIGLLLWWQLRKSRNNI